MRVSVKHICMALAMIAVVSLHNGCIEQMEGDFLPSGDNVSFKATLERDGGLATKGFVGNLDFEENDWVMETTEHPESKAALLNSLDDLDASLHLSVGSSQE